MRFFESTNIDFLGYRRYYWIIAGVLILGSVGALTARKGPALGIDFTGGTLLHAKFEELPPLAEVRDALNGAGIGSFTIQTQPVAKTLIVRVKQGERSEEDITSELMDALEGAFAGNVDPSPERVEFVGPVIGRKLIADTLKAVFGSLIVMILYVAFRFKSWTWGIAGVTALAHDVFVTLGFLTLMNVEITLVVVAAILTLAGYSINDTIVIFDRVRENFRLARKESPKDVLNRSLNDTLARTVNTSVTTLLAALALLLLGGEVIHGFALTLTFGIFAGTFSSVGIAIPLAYAVRYRKKAK